MYILCNIDTKFAGVQIPIEWQGMQELKHFGRSPSPSSIFRAGLGVPIGIRIRRIEAIVEQQFLSSIYFSRSNEDNSMHYGTSTAREASWGLKIVVGNVFLQLLWKLDGKVIRVGHEVWLNTRCRVVDILTDTEGITVLSERFGFQVDVLVLEGLASRDLLFAIPVAAIYNGVIIARDHVLVAFSDRLCKIAMKVDRARVEGNHCTWQNLSVIDEDSITRFRMVNIGLSDAHFKTTRMRDRGRRIEQLNIRNRDVLGEVCFSVARLNSLLARAIDGLGVRIHASHLLRRFEELKDLIIEYVSVILSQGVVWFRFRAIFE